MRIPKTVNIGKRKYRVQDVESFPGTPYRAKIFYPDRLIQVAKRTGVTNRKLTAIERHTAFWHEIVHGALYDMRDPREKDEALVDGVSVRIAKIVRQMEA